MSNNGKARKTPQGCWILAVLALAIVLPAAGTDRGLFAQDDDHPVTLERARTILTQGKLAEAAEMFRQLVEEDDDNALAWHLLGYSLHGQGKLDEALKCHQRAAQFDQTRSLGLYNWACVLALQDQPEAALDKLEESVESGLRLRQPIRQDEDLASLHDLPRFNELVAKLEQTRSDESASNPRDLATENALRQFDFWIGKWNVVDREGQPAGYNEITSEESGNLIRENWKSANGTTGQSINFYDPAKRQWRQTWVDSKGQIMEFTGHFKNGMMVMKGNATLPDGRRGVAEMELEPLDDGRVRQFLRISKDDGKTWTVFFDGYYHPDTEDDS